MKTRSLTKTIFGIEIGIEKKKAFLKTINIGHDCLDLGRVP